MIAKSAFLSWVLLSFVGAGATPVWAQHSTNLEDLLKEGRTAAEEARKNPKAHEYTVQNDPKVRGEILIRAGDNALLGGDYTRALDYFKEASNYPMDLGRQDYVNGRIKHTESIIRMETSAQYPSLNPVTPKKTSSPSGPCYSSPDNKVVIGHDGKTKSALGSPSTTSADGKTTFTYPPYAVSNGDETAWQSVQVTTQKDGAQYVIEGIADKKGETPKNTRYTRLLVKDGSCVVTSRFDYDSKRLTYDRDFCSKSLDLLKTMKSCASQEKQLEQLAKATSDRVAKTYKDVTFDLESIKPGIQNYAIKIGEYCAPYDPDAKVVSQLFKNNKAQAPEPIEIPGNSSGTAIPNEAKPGN